MFADNRRFQIFSSEGMKFEGMVGSPNSYGCSTVVRLLKLEEIKEFANVCMAKNAPVESIICAIELILPWIILQHLFPVIPQHSL